MRATLLALTMAAVVTVTGSACTVHHVHSYHYSPSHVHIVGGIGQPLPAPRLRVRVPAYRSVPRLRRVAPVRPVAPRSLRVCTSGGHRYYC